MKWIKNNYILVLVVAGLAGAQFVYGSPLIANGSFESNASMFGANCCPTPGATQHWNYAGSDSWSYAGSVGTWQISLYNLGGNTYFTNPKDGNDIEFLEDSSSIWQPVSNPTANTTYTLTVYVGHRVDDTTYPAAPYQVGFFDGSNWITSKTGDSSSVGKGTWSAVTVNYTTPSDFKGGLYVRIDSSPGASPLAATAQISRRQLLVDDVGVSSAQVVPAQTDATPEPVTFLLIGGGLLSFALLRNRRKV